MTESIETSESEALPWEASGTIAPAPAAEPRGACVLIDFRQATDLLAMFGGEPNEIALQLGDGHSGRGMYASYTDMPEEGAIFLGTSDQEATPDAAPETHTYASTQATNCAGCGKHKHTPLRIDAMGGYVCLTCIDQQLGSLLGEFGYPDSARSLLAEVEDWLGELKQANFNGHVPQHIFLEASEFAERIKALAATSPPIRGSR